MPNEPDSVLILFMGRQHAHAVTSIQHYAPDAVHIITSDDFRKSYVRRLNDWSKKFGFRKGTVQSVSDLFESTGVPSLLNCVFRVAGHEHAESNGKMETHRWAIGITGGTMHMAAVATTASNILDTRVFYVVKPAEGESIMPNKHVIEMPGLHSVKMAMALNPSDIMMLMKEGKGSIPDLLGNTQIEPWMIDQMEVRGMIEINGNDWRVAPMGKQLFTMLRSGPLWSSVLATEMQKIMAQSTEETTYHG
jgi:hypothetical protein